MGVAGDLVLQWWVSIKRSPYRWCDMGISSPFIVFTLESCVHLVSLPPSSVLVYSVHPPSVASILAFTKGRLPAFSAA